LPSGVTARASPVDARIGGKYACQGSCSTYISPGAVAGACYVQDANGLQQLYESWKEHYGIKYPTSEVRCLLQA